MSDSSTHSAVAADKQNAQGNSGRLDVHAEPAPTSISGLIRQLGPGLIISSIIVGSGELIVTPKLGAEVGFTMLWFIIVGCLVKVFIQIELGRYAITRGKTMLEALNTLPGPRAVVSWVIWLWLAMYLCVVLQLAGMVGGVATALHLGGVNIPIEALAVLIGGSCAMLLVLGRYRLVESASIAMVAGFSVTTLVAVLALQSTEYAVTWAQLARGLAFQLPPDIATAFGAFGIIGVGASELLYYPYWCLGKGIRQKAGTRRRHGRVADPRGGLAPGHANRCLGVVRHLYDMYRGFLSAGGCDPSREGAAGRKFKDDRDALVHVP
ncbi:MAG: Nramp family divalent metal transporter [Opitutaceae bacterium]